MQKAFQIGHIADRNARGQGVPWNVPVAEGRQGGWRTAEKQEKPEISGVCVCVCVCVCFLCLKFFYTYHMSYFILRHHRLQDWEKKKHCQSVFLLLRILTLCLWKSPLRLIWTEWKEKDDWHGLVRSSLSGYLGVSTQHWSSCSQGHWRGCAPEEIAITGSEISFKLLTLQV